MTADDRIINICFHGIGEPGRDLEPGEDRYWVGSDQFLAILDEVATWPAVRISFDDGNISDLRFGLPALIERNLTADYFVLAGRIGKPGSLGEWDVRELHQHGMTIGTHGRSHRSWRGMDPRAVYDELVVARKRLAAVCEAPVDLAACPLGRYDRRLLAELRRLGYTRVFTSDRRTAGRRTWLQPRFSVRREDTPASLRAEVLARPSLLRRSRLSAIGIAKRLR
ncbi:polysaccharide deacetylase family protein [Micromonospora sp. RTP1Z1]|uniref:polysaccharide deacetylase family protein n=1 Tax=Micromonospora sp. RTP1Z1 TaxID=2994043 RepID=UPI0029C98E4E|nr:polysaccharide deacetylase family protein [Micromonospora sp. RTP1Z1]